MGCESNFRTWRWRDLLQVWRGMPWDDDFPLFEKPMVLEFQGWSAGQTANGATNVSLNILDGVHSASGMHVTTDSVNRATGGVGKFAAQFNGCQLQSASSAYSMPLPALNWSMRTRDPKASQPAKPGNVALGSHHISSTERGAQSSIEGAWATLKCKRKKASHSHRMTTTVRGRKRASA